MIWYASHGFITMEIVFRGSTAYGKVFFELIKYLRRILRDNEKKMEFHPWIDVETQSYAGFHQVFPKLFLRIQWFCPTFCWTVYFFAFIFNMLLNPVSSLVFVAQHMFTEYVTKDKVTKNSTSENVSVHLVCLCRRFELHSGTEHLHTSYLWRTLLMLNVCIIAKTQEKWRVQQTSFHTWTIKKAAWRRILMEIWHRMLSA